MVTPVTLDARPNLLKISESASQKELMRRLAQNFRAENSGSGTKSFESMGQKNTYAHQAHHHANCLDHCKHPCHPAYGQNDRGAAQSKRFKWGNRRSGVTEDLTQHNVRKRDKAEPDCP
jgi:hypothetical protein